MGRFVTVCAVLLLVAPVVSGGEGDGRRVSKAETLARDGKPVEAAALFGAELATAQKKGDLALQEQIARSMQRALSGATARGADQRDTYARSLQALMVALDARRNYAFCSAGQVAHELLRRATRTGTYDYVEAAAKVCAQHAKIAKVGLFAKTMQDYASGLLEVEGGNHAGAIEPLASALAVTAEQGWAEPSVYLATELAAACVAADRTNEAVTALQQAAVVLASRDDRAIAQHFRTIATARLEGAPEKVLAACEAAMEPFSGGGSVSAAGGAGAPGGNAGGHDISKIGQAWKKLSGKKPFLAVTRTQDGYLIRQSFDKAFRAEQPYESGVKYHDDGGVTLSFWDGGVRLYMVDPTGLNGQPGESSERSPFVFFDPVALGSTWGVTKKGVVTQAKAR